MLTVWPYLYKISFILINSNHQYINSIFTQEQVTPISPQNHPQKNKNKNMKSAHHLYKTRRIVCITSIRTENNLPLNNIIILLENHEILLSLAMIFSIFSHTDTCDEYYDVGFGFGFLQHICRTIPASTAAAVADATRQQQRKIIENKEEEEKDHCRC